MADEDILFDEDVEEDQEVCDAAAVASLIAASDAIAMRLPLTALLRPYENFYNPDTVFRSVVLTDLFATEPGHGAGGTWLKAVGALCDAADITLYTDAACDRSKAFYLAHGFERTRNQQHMLVRWPPPCAELAALLAERDDLAA